MKVSRKITTIILVISIIFILVGISITKGNTFTSSMIDSSNRKLVNVAVIFHRGDDPYMMRIRESLENIEKENQGNVKFTFFDTKNNIATQNEIIDSAIQSNFDFFILNSVDKKEDTIQNTIYSFKEKDIPIILMNIPPEVAAKTSKLYNKAVFVIGDSKQAGISQGKIIVDLWNNNKKVLDKNGDNVLEYVLLQGPVGEPQAVDRSNYVISTINDAGIKTEQLQLVNAGWIKELAEVSINNLFLRYGGRIEAIISNNDAMAMGAIEALQKYGYNTGNKSKYITIVGVDGLPQAIELIDKGIMAGTVIQDAKVAAEMFYTIGMNLVNNLSPTENTNYKTVNDEIIIPYPYDAYVGKATELK